MIFFFSLQSDPKFDIGKHFVNPEQLHIKPLFIYSEPENEMEHMDVFHSVLAFHASVAAGHQPSHHDEAILQTISFFYAQYNQSTIENLHKKACNRR